MTASLETIGVPFYRPPNEAMLAAMGHATTAQLAGHGSHGPEVVDFERALADYWGVEAEQVVCTDSCTSAMAIAHVVLRSMRVLVPAITWVATANAVEMAGCDVQVCDVDDSGLIKASTDELDECDTVVPVALYGQPMDFLQFGQKKVVLDAAHAFERSPKDDGADATCYSFHTLKSMPIGVGGAVVFKLAHHADQARMTRFHGVDSKRVQWRVGWKATMPAFAAAMGIELLKSVEERRAKRRIVGDRYQCELRDLLMLEDRDLNNDCWHAFVVTVQNRRELAMLLGEAGIGTAHYYPSLHAQPKWTVFAGQELAVGFGDSLLALPMHSEMSHDDVSYVVEMVNKHARWMRQP